MQTQEYANFNLHPGEVKRQQKRASLKRPCIIQRAAGQRNGLRPIILRWNLPLAGCYSMLYPQCLPAPFFIHVYAWVLLANNPPINLIFRKVTHNSFCYNRFSCLDFVLLPNCSALHLEKCLLFSLLLNSVNKIIEKKVSE